MPEDGEFAGGPETPEWAKNLGWLHKQISENWKLFVKPQVFLTIIFSAYCGYLYGASKGEEKTEIARDRADFLKDQVDAYKDRLQGASPDEAAKQMSRLASQVANANKKLEILLPDQARTLTESQTRYLTDHRQELNGILKLPLLMFYWTQGDAPLYAQAFMQQFAKLGVSTQIVEQAVCFPDQTGVMIGVADPKSPSDAAKKFYRLMTDAGFSVHYTTWSFVWPGAMEFDLFFCGNVVDSKSD